MFYINTLSRSISLSRCIYSNSIANIKYVNALKYSTNHQNKEANKPKKEESASKVEDDGVSEWIKELHDTDKERYPHMKKYRRQNYKDPFDRAIGILKDDIRIGLHNYYYFMKALYQLMFSKQPPQETIQEEKNPENTTKDNTPTDSNVESEHIAVILKNRKEDVTPLSKKSTFRKLFVPNQPDLFPTHCDIVIVGGGAIGSSIAYHLKKYSLDGLNVVMVEKDSTYKEASTVLSVGGIRQQFSLPENILLSMYGMEFMHNIHTLLEIEGIPPPCINFQPHGYLTLASEKGLKELEECHYIQKYFKARVDMLYPSQLKKEFPWLNTEGIAGGILGRENEGWFDPWSLLQGLRRKAVHLGLQCVEGEVVGFDMDQENTIEFVDGHPSRNNDRIHSVKVKLNDGEERKIRASYVIMAAGPHTGRLCFDTLGIGASKEGLMAYPVPIEPRKRFVYSFHAPRGPGLATPMVIDPTGAYFRREGLSNMYIAGLSPNEDEEPSCLDLEVDHDYFTDKIWPIIAERVPGFEELKVQGSWAGFYEQNIFDQNGIIGLHPLVSNMIIASGFSGHGIQHSLGVGRGVMELVVAGEFKSIDLSRFSFERIPLNEPVYELGIV